MTQNDPGNPDRSKYTNLFKIKVFVNNVQTKTAGQYPDRRTNDPNEFKSTSTTCPVYNTANKPNIVILLNKSFN